MEGFSDYKEDLYDDTSINPTSQRVSSDIISIPDHNTTAIDSTSYPQYIFFSRIISSIIKSNPWYLIPKEDDTKELKIIKDFVIFLIKKD